MRAIAALYLIGAQRAVESIIDNNVYLQRAASFAIGQLRLEAIGELAAPDKRIRCCGDRICVVVPDRQSVVITKALFDSCFQDFAVPLVGGTDDTRGASVVAASDGIVAKCIHG